MAWLGHTVQPCQLRERKIQRCGAVGAKAGPDPHGSVAIGVLGAGDSDDLWTSGTKADARCLDVGHTGLREK